MRKQHLEEANIHLQDDLLTESRQDTEVLLYTVSKVSAFDQPSTRINSLRGVLPDESMFWTIGRPNELVDPHFC
jgi:hypothetical protein